MELLSAENFKRDIKRNFSNNIIHVIGKDFVSTNPYRIILLQNRFVECIELIESPSKHPYLDYLFADNYNPDMAAKSCEFYGAFFPEHIYNSKSFFNSDDISTKLSGSYYAMSKFNRNYIGLEEYSSGVISLFNYIWEKEIKNRYLDIGKVENEIQQDNIIYLFK